MTLRIRSRVLVTSGTRTLAPLSYDGQLATVTGVTGVHPVYGDPVTVSIRTDAGIAVPSIHVDNLTEQPTIVTNNVPREIVDAWDLTGTERAAFDYLDWEAIERGEDSATFVRYRGDILDLGDMMSTRDIPAPSDLRRWGGYAPDSFFSGLVVRYVDNGDRVIVGHYWS